MLVQQTIFHSLKENHVVVLSFLYREEGERIGEERPDSSATSTFAFVSILAESPFTKEITKEKEKKRGISFE